MLGGAKDEADDGWAFGDVWKAGSPDDEPAGDTTDYVEVLRGDTGMGLDDTVLMEYVLYLGEHGIGATFESYPLEQIKVYVLRADPERADEARRLLAERRAGRGGP